MILFLFILFFLLIPSILLGQGGQNGQNRQKNSKPFKTISISVNYLQNSNRNMFHRYWKPANGFDLLAGSEFYFGQIELGAQISFIRAQNSQQPDYKSIYMYLGWGLEQKLISKLFLYSGFQLGHYYMNFDENNININLKSESEFGFGLKSGLKYFFGNNLFVTVSGRYQIIYTRHRIELSFVSIGLGRSFDTPNWLEEFLN